MRRIGILGISLQGTDVQGLERAKAGSSRDPDAFARELADRLGASELVCLSTCNRFEVVYARETGHEPGREDLQPFLACLGASESPPDSPFFQHVGLAAARHLFRVTASLDSLVLGEDQILGQVRDAFLAAEDQGLTGPVLTPLFERTLRVGKQVRAETDISRHPVSVVSLAAQAVVASVSGTEPRIALLGAGQTGVHAARSLHSAGLRLAAVANRSPEAAARLAAEVGAQARTLEALLGDPVPFDVVVSATASPDAVVSADVLRRWSAARRGDSPLVVVDLAVPRDIEPVPELEASGRVLRIDLEQLRLRADQNRALRQREAERVETLLEEKLRLFELQSTGGLSPEIAHALEDARELFESEIASLQSGRLAHLDEKDRVAIVRWARRTFGRLTHLPLRVLKDRGSDQERA